MFINYLKTAFRILLRHKLYTFINVFGLSLGIACCVLILLFVRSELTYDAFHANARSIVRVVQVNKKANSKTEYSAYVPTPLAPALRSEYPEVIHAARFATGGVVMTRGESSFEETILYTDPDVFAMFDFRFIEGNGGTALKDPNDIVLTRPMAAKYFGTENPIGKQLLVRNRGSEEPFVVAAVMEAMPVNSSIQFDFLASITKKWKFETLKDAWSWSNGSAFLQLAPGTNSTDLERKLGPFIQTHFGTNVQQRQSEGTLSKEADAFSLELQPLTSIHLDTKVESSQEETGKPTYSLILGCIALLVMTIACINFVTMAIGRSANRAKEVGVRKVLGAFRTQLMGQFWGEALFLATIAMGLGIVLAELFLSTFCQLIGKQLVLSLTDLELVGGLVGLLLLVSLAAGSYPALVLSRFEPVEVLKGRFRIGGKTRFTKALVVFQFGLSIFLICAALVLTDQIQFMVSSNLGFHPQQVAILPTFAGGEKAELIADRFRSRVAENPEILSVSATSGAFTHGFDVDSFNYNGEEKTAFVYRIDAKYLETLQIPLVEGRNLVEEIADDRDHGMIVNEAFLRSIGVPVAAAAKRIPGLQGGVVENMNIVGVAKDFHFRSLREEIGPAIMFMKKDWPLDDILIRVAPAKIPETVEYLRQVWKELSPNTPFQLTFMDEDFQKLYKGEMNWARIVEYSTLFAVSLASLGLFGLATLAVTNRTKEIGIRKVLGATGGGMINLVSAEFLKLVLIANLLAWPAAYFAASKFLENYAYHLSLTPWLFLLAGLGALVIAFLTIIGQIVRAVRANPVEALRYE
jgi:putative ABC transport system permease protein